MLGPCFVVLCVLSGFAIILLKKRELVCFTLIMEWLSCSLSLPHGALGWFAVYDCGIAWSYSITNFILEDLKVLRRSPDLLNNVKIGQGQLQLIMEQILFFTIYILVK